MKNLNELVIEKATSEMIKLAKLALARDFANSNVDITSSFEALIEAQENPAKDELITLMQNVEIPLHCDVIDILATMQ